MKKFLSIILIAFVIIFLSANVVNGANVKYTKYGSFKTTIDDNSIYDTFKLIDSLHTDEGYKVEIEADVSYNTDQVSDLSIVKYNNWDVEYNQRTSHIKISNDKLTYGLDVLSFVLTLSDEALNANNTQNIVLRLSNVVIHKYNGTDVTLENIVIETAFQPAGMTPSGNTSDESLEDLERRDPQETGIEYGSGESTRVDDNRNNNTTNGAGTTNNTNNNNNNTNNNNRNTTGGTSSTTSNTNTVTIDDTKASTELPKTGDNLIFLAMGLLFFGVAIIVEIRSKINEEKETK
jgi:hypothetical protein